MHVLRCFLDGRIDKTLNDSHTKKIRAREALPKLLHGTFAAIKHFFSAQQTF